MPIDPNIALGYRGIEVPNPLAGAAQVAQIQNAMQQQQLTGMQIKQLQEDRQELQMIQSKLQAMGKNFDPYAVADILMRSPKTVEKGVAMRERLDEQKRFDALLAPTFGALNFGAPAAAPAAARPAVEPTAATAIAQPVPMVKTIMGANTSDSEPVYAPRAPAAANALAAPAPNANALAAAPAPAANANALAAPNQRSPEELRKLIAAWTQSRDARAKAVIDMLNNELTEATKVHNVAPGTQVMRGGKVVYTAPEKQSEFERSLASSDLSDAEKATLRRSHAAKLATHPPVAGELTAAQRLKLRQDASAAQTAANTNLDAVTDLGKAIKDLRGSPGLSAATGVTGVYLPSFTEGEAAQAEVRLEALRGKITAFGKAAASQSGAIGSIANQEWKILADQVAAINPVKGKKPLLEQLSNLETAMERTAMRIQEAYADLYGAEENLPANLRTLRAAPSKPNSPAAPETPAATGGFKYIGPAPQSR